MQLVHQPSALQRERAQRVHSALLVIVPELWDVAAVRPDWTGPTAQRLYDRRPETWLRLAPALGPDAALAVIDYYVFPALHPPAFQDVVSAFVREVGENIAEYAIEQDKPQYAFAQLSARALHILRHVTSGTEQTRSVELLRSKPGLGYDRPQLGRCLTMIGRLEPTPEVLDFAEALLSGRLDQVLPALPEHDLPEGRICTVYHDLHDGCRLLELQLAAAGRLSHDLYRSAIATFGWRHVHASLLWPDTARTAANNVVIEHMLRLADELIDGLPDTADAFLRAFEHTPAIEQAWFIRGLQFIERAAPKRKQVKADDELGRCIRKLLDLRAFTEGESDQALQVLLRDFSDKTLELALPYAAAARPLIMRHLGWDDVLPVHEQILVISGGANAGCDEWFPDLPNSPDPEHGVIDRAALVSALVRSTPQHLQRYLDVMADSRLRLANTLKYVNSVRGIQRAELEKSLAKHTQNAIKAYGLLPVANTQDVLTRYLTFKRLIKEANRHGPERILNMQAAVQVGLAHLAQAAGYTDATRLEWAMEAQLVDEAAQLTGKHAVKDWQVELALDTDVPEIRVSKAGKLLKAVPPAVRKSEVYAALKDKQSALQDQARRFRKTLEAMMCAADRVTREDLSILQQVPVAKALLDRLIVRTSFGVLGFLDALEPFVVDVRGERHALREYIQIAHVLALFEAEQLAHWQRTIVQRRLVQPFKQVYRELYLLTPAEEATQTYSNRFAGHRVKGDVASRLLHARGWTLESSDIPYIFKAHRAQQIAAELSFPDARHYLGAQHTITTERVTFSRDRKHLPLREVPPLLFSETMRDVDLVVSVANVAEDHDSWSTATFEQRAALVRSLVLEIGLKGVRCEGHFAHVTGSRANYRVHLGSATIHIEPGNYLCIVPAQSDQEHVYLPFAEADLKTSEVISKILLLANDAKISDEGILSQIAQARQEQS